MSDYTNPPSREHQQGAAGGPQGPYPGPQQQPPQHQPSQQQPGQLQPGQYGGPQRPPQSQQQPGQYGPQGQPGGPQQPQQPGQYPPPSQQQPGPYQQPGQYGGPQAPRQQQPGQYQQNTQGQQQYGQQQPGQYGQYAQQPGQYGQPPSGPPGFPQAQQWQPEPRKKRTKLVPLIAVLAVLAVIGGGGIFAYARLNGGDQPASVLPGNAVAYARVDLNPSAGQRVAALRFLMKFPSAKEKIGLTSDQDDLHQKLFDLIKKNAGDDLADVDFEKDIKPWLGDRAGVAAIPGQDPDEPDAVLAVQVKNEDEAAKGLDKLLADEKDKPKRAFAKGYVLLSDEQAAVDAAVAASKEDSLADSEKFKQDMSALGEQGFVSFWADTKGLALATKKLTSEQGGALPEGSAAAALRFDAQYVEVKGVVHGDQSVKVNKSDAGDLVSKLPDTTAGAIGLSDGENLVSTIWTQLEKSTASSGLKLDELTKRFTDDYGLVLPDDVKPLLGKNVAVAVDKDSADSPKIAARMETDPAKAEEVVDKVTKLIRDRSSARIPIEKAKDDDTLVIATDQEYADKVLQGGNLGESENFKQAIPDSKGAVMLGYVDFEAAGSLSKEFSENKDLAALRSGGYTVRVTDDGKADFTLRVVAK